jgi:hypothetical protein
MAWMKYRCFILKTYEHKKLGQMEIDRKGFHMEPAAY